jgi:hypothetical protein
MQVSHTLDRLHVAFDDERLVAHAGLLLPASLAQHLGVRELIDALVDLGEAPGRANPGEKAMTVISSVLAGGDCIDDVDALRSGGCAAILGHRVAAPSTVGTFLRGFRWGHVRQLDAVSREVLARAWKAGAGPGSAPLTVDIDSTICETYGLLKQGGAWFTYTCWPPQPAPATYSTLAFAVAPPTRLGVSPASLPRPSAASGRPGPRARSRSVRTRASSAARWHAPAESMACVSPSRCVSAPPCTA